MTSEQDARTYSRGNKLLLFVLSCLAYATIGFHFSIRSNIAGDLETLFAAVDTERASRSTTFDSSSPVRRIPRRIQVQP